MPSRPQPYTRRKSPPPLMLTDRDRKILEAIYSFDGLMSLKQIDKLFFSGKGNAQARGRMKRLYDHKYLNMPDAKRELPHFA